MNLFSIKNESITEEIISKIESLDESDFHYLVECINKIKTKLHQKSPFKYEPVDCVVWVKSDNVYANSWNPNHVAGPEFKLLEVSILEDGYTQPVVTYIEPTGREVVDGYHRNRICKESEPVRNRVHGYLPVVTINENRTDKSDRIAATIRHNRARGKHKVSAMSDIVLELKRRNWSDAKIGRELGMDSDEVLRLAQITGIAEMFADKDFSEAWEAGSINESDTLDIEEENIDNII